MTRTRWNAGHRLGTLRVVKLTLKRISSPTPTSTKGLSLILGLGRPSPGGFKVDRKWLKFSCGCVKIVTRQVELGDKDFCGTHGTVEITRVSTHRDA